MKIFKTAYCVWIFGASMGIFSCAADSRKSQPIHASREIKQPPPVVPQKIDVNPLFEAKKIMGTEIEFWVDSVSKAPGSFLTGSRRELAFRNDWPDADSLYLDMLIQKLQDSGRILLSKDAPDTLVMEKTGRLVLHAQSAPAQTIKVVSARPIVPRDYYWSENEYVYLASKSVSQGDVPVTNAVWEKRSFPKTGQDNHSMGEQIQYALEIGLKEVYESGNMEKLTQIYGGKIGPRVLTGFVTANPKTGVDTAHYYWLTADQYLADLGRFYKAGKKVSLVLQTLGIYLDPSDDGSIERYWAVVYQGWHGSSPSEGKRYDDGGFLFLNFDFSNTGKLADFNIDYRLWFNNYKAEILEPKRQRWKRIDMDIQGMMSGREPMDGIPGRMENGHFIPDRTVTGKHIISDPVLERIRQDVVNLLRNSCLNCQGK